MKFKELKQFLRQRKNCERLSDIRFYNFWDGEDYENNWLYRFANHHIPLNNKKKLAFFSVFGPRYFIHLDRSNVKIFYTGENVTLEGLHSAYHDHLLKYTDLSIGFEYLCDSNYLRFPLWLMYYVKPDATLEDIKAVFKKLSCPDQLRDKNFCALIARHDKGNIRKDIFNLLNPIDSIDCAGRFLNNTDQLVSVYNDDKIKFLRNYKFNICPENTNTNGYVTEKVFESIDGGCIPIYWGSNNNPEPEVLNKEAILFFDKDEASQRRLIDTVTLLHHSDKNYQEFIRQPRFQPQAAEFTMDLLLRLKDRINILLKNQ